MNTYLAIITTVLVLSQIIRVAQNAIQLHRQNVLFKRQIEDLYKYDITEPDVETQKKFYRLAVAYLEWKLEVEDDKNRNDEEYDFTEAAKKAYLAWKLKKKDEDCTDEEDDSTELLL